MHQSYSRYVFKIHTKRLKSANWKLVLPLNAAKLSGELVSLAESTAIRFIEEIAGIDQSVYALEITKLQKELSAVKQKPNSNESRREVQEIYRRLDQLQFCPEYLCLVCDSAKDYIRAAAGFQVNGLQYRRLLGTTGGIKNKTVVFVSQQTRNNTPLYDQLFQRIENGRNQSIKFVPAKLEAYKALVCSASTKVSAPQGILVAPDCITHFKSDYIKLKSDGSELPEMSLVHGGDTELVDSDGYGLISPDLSAKWAAELGCDYLPAGFCIRNSFCKGMLFTFDFHEFSSHVAQTPLVRDAWGNNCGINHIDIILTTSMLKLWDSYDSIQDYQNCCAQNGYSFSVTKVTPKFLEHERRMNYQFLQSYQLSDDALWQLVEPTIFELTDVLGNDINKALLFLCGAEMSLENAVKKEPYILALMADERVINDPYIQRKLLQLIKKRINEAKIGKIRLHANYSIISGDPYSLCQSIWGLPVTGLLNAGELYNRYWVDCGAKEVVGFRAPMSSHNNIRKMNVANRSSLTNWYRYLNSVTVLNSWDTACLAWNGADKDSDAILLTDNHVLLSNTVPLPAVMCVQQKAEKIIPTEADFIASNIKGFGNHIGPITNRITTQYDLLAKYTTESSEYQELEYRIISGQLYQQNEIDAIKGIISHPMPTSWYKKGDTTDSAAEFNSHLVADRKPFFMVYRYEKDYETYMSYQKDVNIKCQMEFGKPLEQLLSETSHTESELNFISWYKRLLPVIDCGGTMNRLCHLIEDHFAKAKVEKQSFKFDAALYMSGTAFHKNTYKKIMELYLDYVARTRLYRQQARKDLIDREDVSIQRSILLDEFRTRCSIACPNETELCEIILHICYGAEKSKQFAWDICGFSIVDNILQNGSGTLRYLERSDSGTVTFAGQQFSVKFGETGAGKHDGQFYT